MTARRTDMHKLQEAVRLHRLGQSKRRIARHIRVGRDTLARYFAAFEKAGLLEGAADDLPDAARLRLIAAEHLPSKKPKQQRSSVERWRPRIEAMARAGAGPTAIFDFLRTHEDEYVGSLSAVKRLCANLRRSQGPGATFTHAFEERAAYLAQQSSKTAVSKLLRVSWRAVGSIIRRVVDRDMYAKRDRLDGLRHIGIDELSYRRHHEYVTVVVDHERGVVVWSSKGKNAETLRAFFEELGPERSAAIESVTIDMSQAYISVVKDLVPNALLVFDRFHVQRLVQDALDETRRDEVRVASGEDRRALKNTRYALLKNPWNLGAGERQTLEELEEANQSLFRGYLLKESFADILGRRQVNVARNKLVQWIEDAKGSGLEHFARAARTVERHLDGILEYVRTRLTNARTEGLNGKIRTITRRAFGFHSASALISMIFLCCGGVHVTPAFSTPPSFH